MKRDIQIPLVFLALAAIFTSASSSGAFENPIIMTRTCTHNNFRILEAVLPSILARSMRASGNPEGIEAVQFLESHPDLAFRIAVDPSQTDAFGGRPSLEPDMMMSYSDADREFDIHHAFLHLDGSDEERIIRDPARLEKTARSFWPEMVHEISHARDNHHGDWRFIAENVIEEEFIAYYRQVFFVLEQLESEKDYLDIHAHADCAREEVDLQIELRSTYPRAKELLALKTPSPGDRREYLGLRDRTNSVIARINALPARCPGLDSPVGNLATLLSAFGRSSMDYERLATRGYESKRLLSIEDPDLISRARSRNEEDIRSAMMHLSNLASVPKSSPSHLTAVALSESIRRTLDLHERARAFWNDPDRARKAIAEYRAEVSRVRVEAEKKRERSFLLLKAYLPKPNSP